MTQEMEMTSAASIAHLDAIISGTITAAIIIAVISFVIVYCIQKKSKGKIHEPTDSKMPEIKIEKKIVTPSSTPSQVVDGGEESKKRSNCIKTSKKELNICPSVCSTKGEEITHFYETESEKNVRDQLLGDIESSQNKLSRLYDRFLRYKSDLQSANLLSEFNDTFAKIRLNRHKLKSDIKISESALLCINETLDSIEKSVIKLEGSFLENNSFDSKESRKELENNINIYKTKIGEIKGSLSNVESFINEPGLFWSDIQLLERMIQSCENLIKDEKENFRNGYCNDKNIEFSQKIDDFSKTIKALSEKAAPQIPQEMYNLKPESCKDELKEIAKEKLAYCIQIKSYLDNQAKKLTLTEAEKEEIQNDLFKSSSFMTDIRRSAIENEDENFTMIEFVKKINNCLHILCVAKHKMEHFVTIRPNVNLFPSLYNPVDSEKTILDRNDDINGWLVELKITQNLLAASNCINNENRERFSKLIEEQLDQIKKLEQVVMLPESNIADDNYEATGKKIGALCNKIRLEIQTAFRQSTHEDTNTDQAKNKVADRTIDSIQNDHGILKSKISGSKLENKAQQELLSQLQKAQESIDAIKQKSPSQYDDKDHAIKTAIISDIHKIEKDFVDHSNCKRYEKQRLMHEQFKILQRSIVKLQLGDVEILEKQNQLTDISNEVNEFDIKINSRDHALSNKEFDNALNKIDKKIKEVLNSLSVPKVNQSSRLSKNHVQFSEVENVNKRIAELKKLLENFRYKINQMALDDSERAHHYNDINLLASTIADLEQKTQNLNEDDAKTFSDGNMDYIESMHDTLKENIFIANQRMRNDKIKEFLKHAMGMEERARHLDEGEKKNEISTQISDLCHLLTQWQKIESNKKTQKDDGAYEKMVDKIESYEKDICDNIRSLELSQSGADNVAANLTKAMKDICTAKEKLVELRNKLNSNGLRLSCRNEFGSEFLKIDDQINELERILYDSDEKFEDEHTQKIAAIHLMLVSQEKQMHSMLVQDGRLAIIDRLDEKTEKLQKFFENESSKFAICKKDSEEYRDIETQIEDFKNQLISWATTVEGDSGKIDSEEMNEEFATAHREMDTRFEIASTNVTNFISKKASEEVDIKNDQQDLAVIKGSIDNIILGVGGKFFNKKTDDVICELFNDVSNKIDALLSKHNSKDDFNIDKFHGEKNAILEKIQSINSVVSKIAIERCNDLRREVVEAKNLGFSDFSKISVQIEELEKFMSIKILNRQPAEYEDQTKNLSASEIVDIIEALKLLKDAISEIAKNIKGSQWTNLPESIRSVAYEKMGYTREGQENDIMCENNQRLFELYSLIVGGEIDFFQGAKSKLAGAKLNKNLKGRLSQLIDDVLDEQIDIKKCFIKKIAVSREKMILAESAVTNLRKVITAVARDLIEERVTGVVKKVAETAASNLINNAVTVSFDKAQAIPLGHNNKTKRGAKDIFSAFKEKLFATTETKTKDDATNGIESTSANSEHQSKSSVDAPSSTNSQKVELFGIKFNKPSWLGKKNTGKNKQNAATAVNKQLPKSNGGAATKLSIALPQQQNQLENNEANGPLFSLDSAQSTGTASSAPSSCADQIDFCNSIS